MLVHCAARDHVRNSSYLSDQSQLADASLCQNLRFAQDRFEARERNCRALRDHAEVQGWSQPSAIFR
jgi:hypothetical protein